MDPGHSFNIVFRFGAPDIVLPAKLDIPTDRKIPIITQASLVVFNKIQTIDTTQIEGLHSHIQKLQHLRMQENLIKNNDFIKLSKFLLFFYANVSMFVFEGCLLAALVIEENETFDSSKKSIMQIVAAVIASTIMGAIGGLTYQKTEIDRSMDGGVPYVDASERFEAFTPFIIPFWPLIALYYASTRLARIRENIAAVENSAVAEHEHLKTYFNNYSTRIQYNIKNSIRLNQAELDALSGLGRQSEAARKFEKTIESLETALSELNELSAFYNAC